MVVKSPKDHLSKVFIKIENFLYPPNVPQIS